MITFEVDSIFFSSSEEHPECIDEPKKRKKGNLLGFEKPKSAFQVRERCFEDFYYYRVLKFLRFFFFYSYILVSVASLTNLTKTRMKNSLTNIVN